MTILEGSLVCFLDERDFEDSMIVGGYYIQKKNLQKLDNYILEIKQKFNLADSDPIKWNLKDKACINARKLIQANKVDDLRRHVFSIIVKIPLRIIMSHVWKGKPENLEEAWKWAFIDILQRLSIDLERKSKELNSQDFYPFLDVVFDWFPGRGKLEDYFGVYQTAYLNGYKFSENELLPLKRFKACPCLLVTSARYSQALQLTDFFIGVTSDFFKWCYNDIRKQNVDHYFSQMFKAFLKCDDGKVLGCGLITKKDSRCKIRRKLKELKLEG
ncbi:MAG: hypothetical protein JW776_02390 [Candidatus Lokiarchaeota archaeon]|nr:hypothetical protein [Candidatus Lokiarchaeota archaeon]